MTRMVVAEASEMRHQLTKFASALSSFSASTDTFRLLSSLPPPPPASHPPSTLYVLDSSFNPPTLAHLHLATSALAQVHGAPPKRLLLLLATHNADKAPQPAAFEQRLVLMTLLAHNLRKNYRATHPRTATTAAASSSPSSAPTDHDNDDPAIDIAITKHPYFIDKATAIAASTHYPPSTTQVHLTGYDTLIRILNPKYYPPAHTLAPLGPLLARHRLRVTYRPNDGWGDSGAQDAYLEALGRGEREPEGGRREWRRSIELVAGMAPGGEVVSSSRVREAARRGDAEALGGLVTEDVRAWILAEKLYRDG